MTSQQDQQVADAVPENWVDIYAPRFARPYLRLARADRPIGTWLLLWPCLWSITLAPNGLDTLWRDLELYVLFSIGAFVMRGAGCTFNDIVDRDFDAQVARTASRPIPSGAVSVKAAWAFLMAQCLIGLLILLALNNYTIMLGITSLGLVAIYPFMKRITYWPQAFLGLTFNWGALMGWSAVMGSLSTAPILLYVGGLLWTLGYDTIYAHQDKEDDALIGVKSSALRLGDKTQSSLWFFYGLTFVCFSLAGAQMNLHWIFYILMSFAGGQLVWQIKELDSDDPAKCLMLFKSNRTFGALVFVAILVGSWASP